MIKNQNPEIFLKSIIFASFLISIEIILVGGKGVSSKNVLFFDFEPLTSGTLNMCHRVPIGGGETSTPSPNPESYHSSHKGN